MGSLFFCLHSTRAIVITNALHNGSEIARVQERSTNVI
jgi:hypothetical protein